MSQSISATTWKPIHKTQIVHHINSASLLQCKSLYLSKI